MRNYSTISVAVIITIIAYVWIIDRFGEDVETHLHDDNSFSVVAEISASATFYSWVFTYGGKMKIVEPKSVRDEYERRLNEALKNR